ncbi:MAG: hypothetical protein ACTMIR_06365 [Cellulomonadaceae bacterium]
MTSRRARWAACTVLAALTLVLAAAGLAARSVRDQLLDTEHYVALVAPLARDEAVQAQVVESTTAQIMDRLEVSALTSAALEALVHELAQRAVASQQFATLWEAANRRAHGTVVGVLTGRSDTVLAAPDGTVSVDLSAVARLVRERLSDRGLALAERVPDIDVRVAIGTFPQVASAQRAIGLLDRGAAWLPWLALATAAAVMLAAPRRAGGLAATGAALALGGVTVIGALAVLRARYDDAQAPDAGVVPGLVIDRLTEPLRADAGWLVTAGLALVLAAGVWALAARRRRAAAGHGTVLGPPPSGRTGANPTSDGTLRGYR